MRAPTRKASTLFHAASRPIRWICQLEQSGRFAVSLFPVDLLLGMVVILAYRGIRLNQPLQFEMAANFAAALAALHLLGCSYAQAWPVSPVRRLLRLIAINALAAAVMPFIFGRLQIDLDGGTIIAALAFFTPLQVLLHHLHFRRRATTPLEPLRWLLASAGATALAHPFLTANIVGTGDAYWYGIMVGDFVTQWRNGGFPAFVGQSEFAFNGAVSPLRFAPYLQHAAGLLDIVTLRSLTFPGLLNLVLFGSIVAGTLSAYVSLVAINRASPWSALVLALLFVSSPGVLALAYTGYLFMSICTLPYVPLVLLAIHRTLAVGDLKSVGLLAAALAASWHCHPPIAFWLTVLATVGQITRLPGGWRDQKVWRGWLAGAALFGVLTLGLFVSVGSLRIPTLTIDREQLIANLNSAFPLSLLPVSDGAAQLSDYQLGWSLWVVLIVAVVVAAVRRRPFELVLVGVAVFMTVLLLPVPGLTAALWSALPQAVCDLTFYWPMQRFYVLLAGIAVFAAYAGLAELVAKRWWLHGAALIALVIALDWSWVQAELFLRRGVGNRTPDPASQLASLPQNRVLTRYAYGPFPAYPPYFSHGYVDPTWENRLLAPVSFRVLDSNFAATAGPASVVRATGRIIAKKQDASGRSFRLEAPILIQPGRHYALEFVFNQPALQGSLLASSPTVAREYYLPDSGVGVPRAGPTTAFGNLATSRNTMSLKSSAIAPEKISFQFISNESVAYDITDFGRYTLREYDPERLPIVIESWTPYRAKVDTPERAWLETPRIFIEGYAATVDGRPAPVQRSPSGLAMVAVEPGGHRVTLSYPGPLVLRVSYFASLLAWAGLVVVVMRAKCRRSEPESPTGRGGPR